LKIIESIQITRYENGCTLKKEDNVIAEYSLAISVNGIAAADILCTPSSLRELIIGFLFCKGIIQTKNDVKEILIEEGKRIANVLLVPGAPADGLSNIQQPSHDFTVSTAYILKQANLFYGKSALFMATGAIHSCCLCDERDILYFEEDISRHNAVDKVIGRALSDSVSFDSTFLITSGRIPSDMMVKIIRCGIPIIVSRSAPTDAAAAMAKEHGVTLAGFARGGCMNIYSGEWRLK